MLLRFHLWEEVFHGDAEGGGADSLGRAVRAENFLRSLVSRPIAKSMRPADFLSVPHVNPSYARVIVCRLN